MQDNKKVAILEEEEEKEEPFEKAYSFVACHFVNSLVNKGPVGGRNDLFLLFFTSLSPPWRSFVSGSIARERIGISWIRTWTDKDRERSGWEK